MIFCLIAGCASSARSVRAVRQYEREPADLNAALDRIADLNACLVLVEALLLETPYSPGDAWVQALPMTDASASTLETELRESSSVYRNGELRVPVAKLYRTHVERALASRVRAPAPAYPNVLSALGALGSDASALEGHWKTMQALMATMGESEVRLEGLRDALGELDSKQKARRDKLQKKIEGEQARLDAASQSYDAARDAFVQVLEGAALTGDADPQRAALLGDMVTIASVVARLELEAASLAPIIGVQLLKGLRDPSSVRVPELTLQGADEARNIVVKLADTPGVLASIATRLQTQLRLLVPLAELLGSAQGISLSDTPGYLYGESASSQVIGMGADSFYFEARAGGEALFFHHAPNDQAAQDDAKLSFNLDDRNRYLKYAVEPIILASFEMDAGFDLLDIPNFINLDFGYKTDRVYKSGGDISESEAGALDALGVDGTTSDVLSFGLAVAGVRSRLKLATFTSGEVGLFDAANDELIVSQPLQFGYTDIVLSYDIFWWADWEVAKTYFDSFLVSFRYLDYQLPRIVYVFEDRNAEEDVDEFFVVGESPPQDVRTQYYMGGIELSRGGRSSGSRLLFDLGLFVGAGPSSYYLTIPEETEDKLGVGLVVESALGWALSLTSAQSSLQFDLQLVYEGQLIGSTFLTQTSGGGDQEGDLGEMSTNFGGFDIFHGPKFRMNLAF